ncbi:MAG: fumarylacetoacetate hydrolase family protein [Euryhalocaulis sp.]|uniref:fumarylacetoacetate hydrolase family protein n=1 Tax=Euryhalocaulis sp. TaxID=2744307 RepID=UPI0018440376|nr:fumarylacetoacetate hydrolase family protein [Euryhalocaulis sp.]MBA4800310.1 fumarylacetoacetate hydrolase family protein [Euryhalocaulis sp.]
MRDFVFQAADIPSVAVKGTGARFPVRRIFCVGKNYAAHVAEMGGDAKSDPPVFFTKPADAVAPCGADIPYPTDTDDLHHEAELVIALGRGGADIPAAEAAAKVFGYAVGVDLTRRDRQAEAKAKGRPWDVAKAFDNSAPISDIVPLAETGHPSSGRIWLSVDGVLKQDGDLSAMIWSVPEIIAALSRSFELKPGDLVFTGTPEGVGPIARGQRVEAGVDGVGELDFRII